MQTTYDKVWKPLSPWICLLMFFMPINAAISLMMALQIPVIVHSFLWKIFWASSAWLAFCCLVVSPFFWAGYVWKQLTVRAGYRRWALSVWLVVMALVTPLFSHRIWMAFYIYLSGF